MQKFALGCHDKTYTLFQQWSEERLLVDGGTHLPFLSGSPGFWQLLDLALERKWVHASIKIITKCFYIGASY
jgi:hypothetical protein